MAAQERVYILSPDYWGFDPATQDSALNFFTNVWTLPKATYDSLGEEDRARLYRCALFYHTKRVDNHGFTPVSIFDKEGDLMVRGTGRGGQPQVRKYSKGSQSPPYTVDTVTMAAADPSATTWDELADQSKQTANGTFTIGSYLFDENKIMDTINNLESEVGTIVSASAAESYAAESTPASVAVDVSEPLSANPTTEAPSGSEVVYEAPANRTDREGPQRPTLKHRMSAKDRALARRKAREDKEARIQAGLNMKLDAETEMSQLMTSNAVGQAGADYDHEIHFRAPNSERPIDYIFNRDNELEQEINDINFWIKEIGRQLDEVSSENFPAWEDWQINAKRKELGIERSRFRQRLDEIEKERKALDNITLGAEGRKSAGPCAACGEEIVYHENERGEVDETTGSYQPTLCGKVVHDYGVCGKEYSDAADAMSCGCNTCERLYEEYEKVDAMSAEDEAVLAHYANWSEDSTMLSGNGVPTYYGSAETFEAPMARFSPGKDDVDRVLASLRSRYSGLRVKSTPVYMTMRSGSSNKYHVFVRTNKGNFNGYGRIGYAPTIHGPMSDSEYDRKLRAKQRPSKGYEETKYAEADYSPLAEAPSPHEPYSFMDEMTPNGEFITSDEFMELMSETLDGMSLRYEKPSMFGSPMAMGVGGALVAFLGYKLWSKRSDSTE